MKRLVMVVAMVLCLSATSRAATVYEVYRVQPGDTVESIADAHHISADDLRALNPHLQTGTLTVHELITVPASRASGDGTTGENPAGKSDQRSLRTMPNGVNHAGSIRDSIRGSGTRLFGPDGQPLDTVTDATAPLSSSAGGREIAGGDNAVEPPRATPRPAGSLPMVQPPSGPLRKNFALHGAVGRLGIVSSDGTPIRRERRADGPLVYTALRGTKLVVVSQLDDWYGVMMVDRSTCWVRTEFVELTSTELVAGQAAGQGAASQLGIAVVRTAYRYLGVPYRWGGDGFRGIDCSGLVQQSYRAHGVTLPRVSRDQFQVGQPVPWNQLQPGDRVFFASNGRRIDHVGLYVGNGQFIHASGRRKMVCIDNLFNPRYWSIFVGAKR